MKKVTIIGVGALGSHVALFLRNEADLKLIDMDRIEQKNVLAQFHSKPGVGKNKAQSLQQSMGFLFGLKPTAVPHRLTADNATQLLSGADLLLDCLDNAPAREVVQAFARHTKTPCLHGALAADGSYGRVVWDENFVIDSENVAGQATCEGGEHLPFIAVASSMIAKAAQDFLLRGKKLDYAIHPGGVMRT
jgi:molybdopterin-synthase adenylyltransferase